MRIRTFAALDLRRRAVVASPLPARAEDGKAVYEAICTNCHGPDGRADTKKGKALKAKNYADVEKLRGSPEEVAAFVQKAVREDKKHKQVTKKVSDAQLKEVAVYVRLLATGGANVAARAPTRTSARDRAAAASPCRSGRPARS